MPQTFYVLRCYSCRKFCVKQKTKSSKWKCVVCGEKQTRKRIYATSDRAKDCRLLCQKYSLTEGLAEEQAVEADCLASAALTLVDDADNEDPRFSSPEGAEVRTKRRKRSRWLRDDDEADENPQVDENGSSGNAGSVAASQKSSLSAIIARHLPSKRTRKRLRGALNHVTEGDTCRKPQISTNRPTLAGYHYEGEFDWHTPADQEEPSENTTPPAALSTSSAAAPTAAESSEWW